MSESFELEAPDHFTAGAIGLPGERVFYLQMRQGRTLVTLKCEKEHVHALGRYFGATLAKLPAETAGAGGDSELIEFVEPAWIVAAIGGGWDGERDRFMVAMKELLEEEETEPEATTEPEPATARVWITRAQAAAFVERAVALMKAGRPICSMCRQPKDPGGHICPRGNGHYPAQHVAR
jgi:uncharacterized repeat protein (TIGR03847 family)